MPRHSRTTRGLLVAPATMAAVAAGLLAPGLSAEALAADTFTAPAYTDPDCEIAFGSTVLGLTPDMIGSVVGLPIPLPSAPAPQTVVIVSMGQTASQTDVRGMLQYCGLNPLTWTDVLKPGDTTPGVDSEATLDLTVISAMLPANTTLKTATIASSIDFKAALLNAGNACGLDGTDWTQWRRSQLDTPTGGCIASMSYAVFEDSLPNLIAALSPPPPDPQLWFEEVEGILAALASSGVITVVSSGDEGSGGCLPLTRGQQNLMAPQWPSTSAHALSVGGTMWAPTTWNGAAITPVSYVPGQSLMPVTWRNWNMGSDCLWDESPTITWPGIGTTGGVSDLIERPSYQSSVAGVAPSSVGRLSPDLAGLAGWPTWLVPDAANPGQFTYAMGTSAAAPLMAAGLAQVNAALTSRGMTPLDNSGGPLDIHEVIYSPAFASVFNDVTQGTSNLWSSDLWTGPTAVTTVGFLQGIGFLDSSVPPVPTANTSASITGYTAGVGYDLTTGLGVPNFATLARLLIAAQTPSPGGPPPILQQVPVPASGSCDLVITDYDWGGASSGGWSRSWAQWTNGGSGGPVCTRTLVYSGSLRYWIVQR